MKFNNSNLSISFYTKKSNSLTFSFFIKHNYSIIIHAPINGYYNFLIFIKCGLDRDACAHFTGDLQRFTGSATADDSGKLKRSESVTGTSRPVDQNVDRSKSHHTLNQTDDVRRKLVLQYDK